MGNGLQSRGIVIAFVLSRRIVCASANCRQLGVRNREGGGFRFGGGEFGASTFGRCSNCGGVARRLHGVLLEKHVLHCYQFLVSGAVALVRRERTIFDVLL